MRVTESCHRVTGQLSQAWAGLQRARESRPGPQRQEAASQLSSLLSPASAAQPRAGDSAATSVPHALWTDIKVTWLLLSPGPHLELTITDINIGLRQPLGDDDDDDYWPLSAPWILSTWTVFTDWLTLVLSGSDNVVQSLLASDGAAEKLLATPDTCHTGHSAMTGVRWANTFMMRIMWKECIYWFWTEFNVCLSKYRKQGICLYSLVNWLTESALAYCKLQRLQIQMKLANDSRRILSGYASDLHLCLKRLRNKTKYIFSSGSLIKNAMSAA